MHMSDNKLAVDGGIPVRSEGFAEWPIYDQLEEQLLLEVLHSGKWGGVGDVKSGKFAPKIPEFERKFAEYQEAQYAIACSNGTVAITIALQAAGVGPGDEIIIPPYTFIATASAALAYGVTPVFADIDPETLLIDPAAVEKRITPKTKAIVAVHIAGASADLTRLQAIADRHGLVLIEDSAQAVGAEWEHRKVGAIGHIGTFSFQSSKNLNAGEGGIIVTNSKALWEKAWSIVNVGRIPDGAWYQHERIGQNYRLTEFQAAILLAQLTRLDEQMETRSRNAVLLDSLLEQVEGITPARVSSGTTRHAYHLYMLLLSEEYAARIEKNDLIRKVNAEGIPLAYGYVSLNQNRAIRDAIRDWTGAYRDDACPVSEALSDKRALWLPQNLLLSDEQAIRDTAAALQKVLRTYR